MKTLLTTLILITSVVSPVFGGVGDVYYCEMASNTDISTGGTIVKRETKDFYFSIQPDRFPQDEYDFDIKIFGKGFESVGLLDFANTYPVVNMGDSDINISDYDFYRTGTLRGENFSFAKTSSMGAYIVTAYCNKT